MAPRAAKRQRRCSSGHAAPSGGGSSALGDAPAGAASLASLPHELLAHVLVRGVEAHVLRAADLARVVATATATRRLAEHAEAAAHKATSKLLKFPAPAGDRASLAPEEGETWTRLLRFAELLRASRRRIAAGEHHTVVASKRGLCTFGEGYSGELGRGLMPARRLTSLVPRSVKGPVEHENVSHVAAGQGHTAVVTETGRLYTFGCERFGQLGSGVHAAAAYLPVHVTHVPLRRQRVVLVSTGDTHTAVVTAMGNVFTCGMGGSGQLGLGTRTMERVPRPVRGALVGRRVVSVAAGAAHTVVATVEGEVYAWGAGDRGQLGLGHHRGEREPCRVLGDLEGSLVVQVCAGGNASAAVSSSGRLFLWGAAPPYRDETGASAQKKTATRALAAVPRAFEHALLGHRVKQVDIGADHLAVVTESGSLFTCGQGHCGQLGHGDGQSRSELVEVKSLVGKHVVQVAVGAAHTVITVRLPKGGDGGAARGGGAEVAGVPNTGASGSGSDDEGVGTRATCARARLHRSAGHVTGGSGDALASPFPDAPGNATVPFAADPAVPSHSARYTYHLYTFGQAKHGALGHDSTTVDEHLPRLRT